MLEIAKKVLKKTTIGKNISEQRRLKNKKIVFNGLINEYIERYEKYSSALCEQNDKKYLRARIVIESHVIEKGLSHENFKPGFGKDIISSLASHVIKYANMDDNDKFAISNAVSLLDKYHSKNIEHKFDDSSYIDLDSLKKIAMKVHLPEEVGTRIYDVDSAKNELMNFDFFQYESLRSSIRVFDFKCNKISPKILSDIVDMAKYAPSACNRQSVRVHYIQKEEDFLEIEGLQRGSKGFLRNASAIAFITSDLSLYESLEYKLPIFDAGLFSMNFLYSVQSKGLFSCILNGYFNAENTQRINQIVGIPENEEITCVVAIYDIPQDKKILVPVSPKRDTQELFMIK